MDSKDNKFLHFDHIYNYHNSYNPYTWVGKIIASKGMLFETRLPTASIGCTVEFVTDGLERSPGEVVSIKGKNCYVMPYNDISGINSNTKIYLKSLSTSIKVSDAMLGRVVDFLGNPIDGKGPLEGPFSKRSIFGAPINPLLRPPIREPLDTGISAINCFTTAGKGQRLGIMSGSGVGKSVLLGMIARNTNANVNVIALIGERGREVLEFIESDLGEEGLKRSVVVVATSDTSPLIRTKAAYTATTIAEYFRDQSLDVVLLMDSITRFAMANREISLSAGEPPGQKGYTPSVFAKLPKLMERAGNIKDSGSITGIYTVLVEGDDMDEPIADAVRSISDGHIILSRALAHRNHFPAIDVLGSISRVMTKVISNEHRIVASHLRDLLASYNEAEDLINVGAYVRGTNPKVDKAMIIYDDLIQLLRQDIGECESIESLYDQMVELARKAEMAVNPDLFTGEEEEENPSEFNVV
ncbi:MAG: FliI/YscN family ATPase [Bacteriovoracaceae bacterium]|jgi:flagellum-specific ATP synthase|nr:FliI/YscN family ATPase [Bacteriovoracaceae bacterium]